MPTVVVRGVYKSVVAEVVWVATNIPPLLLLLLLLYHSYLVIDPLPAAAVIDKAVDVPFWQILCVDVEGWLLIVGNTLTVVAVEEVALAAVHALALV